MPVMVTLLLKKKLLSKNKYQESKLIAKRNQIKSKVSSITTNNEENSTEK